jgi:hypothetical protein
MSVLPVNGLLYNLQQASAEKMTPQADTAKIFVDDAIDAINNNNIDKATTVTQFSE